MSKISPKSFTSQQIKDARRAGFKMKVPKKPKRKTEDSIQNYFVRYNNWVDRMKDAASQGAAIRTKREQIQKMKGALSGLGRPSK